MPAQNSQVAQRSALGAVSADVAYFSMEMAFDDAIPTFSGGLGVLAADFLKSAADQSLPIVGVTLAYRDGYFQQHIDEVGRQHEMPVSWEPASELQALDAQVQVQLAGRSVFVKAWCLSVGGVSGHRVPVLFLDTNLEENEPSDRAITDQLYGGDRHHRLAQEAVLGLGGVAILKELGFAIDTFHLNEGHASLLMLALVEDGLFGDELPDNADLERVRAQCIFTTHTPVPAGHDVFGAEVVSEVLGDRHRAVLDRAGCLEDFELNMTKLGMKFSRYVNAVSVRHRDVTRAMFPQFEIHSVTNGVHLDSWVSEHMAKLFDEYLGEWRQENVLLRYATCVPIEEIADRHQRAKRDVMDLVAAQTGVELDRTLLTIGLARRATPYKQTTLLFSDLERLEKIARSHPIQIICAGKAHPHDEPGKQLIVDLVSASKELRGAVSVVFLENYDLSLARQLCAGVDVWLNTPIKPHEASGTSGMKAAANGVPSLSVLDGWWLEGWIENVTGWCVGNEFTEGDDGAALYDKLERVVAPMYYQGRTEFHAVMRSTIALVGSFFNTERMVGEYWREAYGR